MKNDNYKKIQELPPYGELNSGYITELKNGPLVPPDWSSSAASLAAREKEWLDWRKETLDLIAAALWPIFNRDTRKWEGASKERMAGLTSSDLELMETLRDAPNGRQLNKTLSPLSRALDCPLHKAIFKFEDGADPTRKFGDYYRFYDASLDSAFLAAFPSAFLLSLKAKDGTTSLQFKAFLQRPRAYQTALLLGFKDYAYEGATSADTPSISSGHCFQGIVAVGGIMERIIQGAMEFSKASWAALEHYAVDIGDRRVMAGVHYPSDNLASWIMAMRLADHIYKIGEVKKRLWNAISKRSFVYGAIKKWAVGEHEKYYRPSLEALKHAALPYSK